MSAHEKFGVLGEWYRGLIYGINSSGEPERIGMIGDSAKVNTGTASADAVKEDSVTLTADAADELVIANMDGFKTLVFTVSGNTADTFIIKFGYDTDTPPTLVSGGVRMLDLAVATETYVVAVPAAGGTYEIRDIAAKSIWFDRTGGANTPTITWKARKS